MRIYTSIYGGFKGVPLPAFCTKMASALFDSVKDVSFEICKVTTQFNSFVGMRDLTRTHLRGQIR